LLDNSEYVLDLTSRYVNRSRQISQRAITEIVDETFDLGLLFNSQPPSILEEFKKKVNIGHLSAKCSNRDGVFFLVDRTVSTNSWGSPVDQVGTEKKNGRGL
jgi:hypothetical protein